VSGSEATGAPGASPGPAWPAPQHLVVGHVSKPHGTKGELFIWPLTDRPDEVFAAGSELLVASDDGQPDAAAGMLVVERARAFKRGRLVKFEGLEDRGAVEAWAGRYLVVPIDRVAALEEGEVFYHQLLGLDVVTVDGERVGVVREVYETEPAHLLEVVAEGGRKHLIPFARRIVKVVDVAGGRLVIDPPPGLLEL
jgi:16S rRNA processing protein RimM